MPLNPRTLVAESYPRHGWMLFEDALAALSVSGILYLLTVIGLRGVHDLLCAGMCIAPPPSDGGWQAWVVSGLLVCTTFGELVVAHRRGRGLVFHGLVTVFAASAVVVFAAPLI